MNNKYRLLAEQFLIAQLIFISFILLFEGALVLPPWAQAVGRMHPLLLHFPIVLLLMSFTMQLFRRSKSSDWQYFYDIFTRWTLLLGVLLSGFTVLMGVFLASEPGYSGDLLLWHKWSGIGIYFFSAILYLIGWWPRVSPIGLKILSIPAFLLLIVAGHFGAALTHGEGFVTDPLKSADNRATVSPDSARVFEHVVHPILQQKCLSCHNADKVKGELLLTDMSSLLKGGKSGKLFVAGNPELSLLLERIHLPQEDKKHMPPSGKAQLTSQEIKLLYHWVKSYAQPDMKLRELPLADSLRILSTAYLKSGADANEPFDFEAVDDKLLAQLNTDYRTVARLAINSPALTVNIYNKKLFDAQQITGLEPVSKQVVALNLNKMPVKDKDMVGISKLVNLRRLDLNFTEITAAGLRPLQSLKHLQQLSLSGTSMEVHALVDQLDKIKSLTQVILWDAGLTDKDFQLLEQKLAGLTVVRGFKDDGSKPLQLNPIQVRNASMVFRSDLDIDLFHPIGGTEIRYTIDGSEPDSLRAPVFQKLKVDRNTFIRAKAYKSGWYGSETARFDFLKNTYKPDSVRLAYVLNRVHKAAGAHTFFDGKLGQIGANNPAWANYWAGVRDTDIELYAEFQKPISLSSVGVHYMVEEDTGIFPPEKIEVWGANKPGNWKLLTRFKAPLTQKGETPSIRLVEGKFAKEEVSFLKIIASPVKSIPIWSKRKGNKALLLVDEMFLN
ncbi:c-type cytochrome domain-containing protein [Dyadobacter tibetensis]|uniref:c-type cytochrome domain-containing protein n=1 Tax=Dyadobacter tibetensis TaxID=1211851 RepID=UPI0004719B78|nr:c-type cytochrome domain-containing protein [Dyadobacter tibetensis]